MQLIDRSKALILRRRLIATLTAVILLAFLLVAISMVIYYSSGASQLDLSRPEYKSVRSQIDTDTKTTNLFDAQGPIDEVVLDDFLARYKEKSDRVLEANAFSNEVLNDEQLGIAD